MDSFLITIAAILITYFFTIFGLTGTGLLVQRIYGLKRIGIDSLINSFWVGFAVILCIGQIWHLILPADGRIWIIIFFLGLVGITLVRKQIKIWLWEILKHWKIVSVFGIVIILLAVEIAFLAAHSVPVHDTGSYHLPATLWSHTYPIVPGLSNLHSRLGFNSSLFVFAASFSEGIWVNRPHHVMMGPLILMVYLPALVGIKRIFSRSNKLQLADLLAATFIAPVYYIYHWWNYASSLSPNGVVFLLMLISTWLILRGIPGKLYPKKISVYYLFSAVLLLVAATTIKLTIAPFALIICLFLVGYLVKKKNFIPNKVRLKPILWIIVWSFLLIGPWLSRSVILSGYPFYPLTFGKMNVEWCVPEIQAELDAEWTHSYSRACYNEPPKGYEWVIPWLKGQFWTMLKIHGLIYSILLFILSMFIITLFLIFQGMTILPDNTKTVIWLFGFAIFGLVLWFLTAPDVRFGIGFFWLIACLPASIALGLILQCPCFLVKRISIFFIVGILAFVLIKKVYGLVNNISGIKHESELTYNCNSLVDLINDGLTPLPVVKTWKYTTLSGLSLNVPFEGNQLWDAPLLSSPHPSPGLALRNQKSISEGFYSEGEWRPYGYPILMYKWHKYVEKRLNEEYKESIKVQN